jgi:hypothetical protein
MADDDLRDQISGLEAHIDELTEVIESCRKAILVSKVVIAAGAIWLLAFTFGAIRFDPMALIGAISAVIGVPLFADRTRVHRSRLWPTSKPPKHSGPS